MPKLIAEGLNKKEFNKVVSSNSFGDDEQQSNNNIPISSSSKTHVINEYPAGCTLSFWAKPSRNVDILLKYWLSKLGRKVAYHPLLFAILPFVVSIIFISGIPLLTTETQYHKLWYPTNTEQFKDLSYMWNHYGFDNRSQILIISLKKDSIYSNSKYGILDKKAIEEVYQIQNLLTNESNSLYQQTCSRLYITYNSSSTSSSSSNYDDSSPCVTNSLLDIWGTNSKMIENKTQLEILSDINQNELKSTFGIDLFLPSIIGDVTYNTTSTTNQVEVQSAQALQLVYSLDRNKEKKSLKYELQFEQILSNYKSNNLNVYYAAFRTFQDESDEAIAEDQIYVTWAMILMIFYVSFMLGKFDPIHSKILLSLCIIITIMLSLIFAFGMSGFLGYPLSQLSLMAIFILLGVGVDDMFIMVDAWDRADVYMQKKYCNLKLDKEEGEIELKEFSKYENKKEEEGEEEEEVKDFDYIEYDAERLAMTFSDIGASILLTSLTDFTALLIGSTISIPAVSYFCITAALSVLAIFSIQVTFFASMLIFDERRVRAQRLDILFCVKCPTQEEKEKHSPPLQASEQVQQQIQVTEFDRSSSPPKSPNSPNHHQNMSNLSPTGVSLLKHTQVETKNNRFDRKDDDGDEGAFKNRNENATKQTGARLFLSNRVYDLATFILHPYRALLVVFVFLAVDLSIGILALNTVSSSADWSEFLPEGSQLLEFYTARDEYSFGSTGSIQFTTTKTIDIANNEHIDTLIKLYNESSAMDFVVGIDSWFNTFMTWCEDPRGYNGTSLLSYADGDETKRNLLKLWIEDQDDLIGGYRYAQAPMIVFEKGTKGDEGYLKTSRFFALTISYKPNSLSYQVKNMHIARGVVRRLGVLDIKAVALEYAYLAREERMWGYTQSTILRTLFGVFMISLLFLEPWLALLTTCSVGLVVLALFGSMSPIFWNIKLNISSFINLVLAIGFAVDYSAHIAEGFMVKGHHSDEGQENSSSSSSSTSSSFSNNNSNHHLEKRNLSPRERVHETMTELGGSVLNGGLSTLLGVLVLIFSDSAGFVTLFKMFLSMVIFGLLHGLVFLPCMIYIVSLFILKEK